MDNYDLQPTIEQRVLKIIKQVHDRMVEITKEAKDTGCSEIAHQLDDLRLAFVNQATIVVLESQRDRLAASSERAVGV
jgi:hypothetical protein